MYFNFICRSRFLYSSGEGMHNDWEIILNLEGSGTQWMCGRPYPFTEGTVFCVPPKTLHGKYADNGFRDIFIAYPHMSLPRSEPFFMFQDEGHCIEQLMTVMHDIYHKQEYNYMDISDQLARALEQIVISRINATVIDPRVSAITNLAVRHFTEYDFSITDAIAEAGYCKDHLRRLFRREIGKTPLEYLTDLRINYAKKLMRENSHLHYTVAQISSMVGFNDVCYFSRVFKKSTGVSPRDYINRNAR